MSAREFVFLFSKVAGQQNEPLLKRYLFSKDFVRTCFLRHTLELLLPVYGKCASQKSSVKTCVKKGNIFLPHVLF